MNRRDTREVRIGDRIIGGNNPILIQSMTNTKTEDVKKTLEQIHRLEESGCEIVRVAVPTSKAAKALGDLKSEISIPLVADIHYNPDLAIESIKNGADKIRINPGNIGGLEETKRVLEVAKDYGIPIRVGVNSGSVEEELLQKTGNKTDALVESALKYLNFFEKNNFNDLVFSLKASSVPEMIEVNRKFAQTNNYPLHLGVTEAGVSDSAIIKSAVGIGSLLSEGIGDTIRVSLTGKPEDEIEVARQILESLDLSNQNRVNIISCPTCGRTNIDLISIANEVNERLKNVNKDLTVAVMGCPVNGPGEAKDADIGLAGGKGFGLIFKKGEVIKKVEEKDIIDSLMEEIENL